MTHAPRITFRITLFAAVVAYLDLWPLYIYLFALVTLNHAGLRYKTDYVEVNLNALGFFPFDPQQGTLADIPADFRALDGRRVVIEGQIYTGMSATDEVSEFQLVWSFDTSHFGGALQVQQRVFATVPYDRSLPRPRSDYARVTGILHVAIRREQGYIASVYTLDVEKIDPL